MVKFLQIICLHFPNLTMDSNNEFIAIAFPQYLNEFKRLSSFIDVAKFSSFEFETFANAGFFYAGTPDRTVCYYCGGGLRQWTENEDPWIEHGKWFPRCPHILIKRGKDFVDKCSEIRRSTCSSKKEDKRKKCEEKEDEEEGVPTALQCIVCYGKMRKIVFFPCGHCCVCTDCCTKIDSCSYCRSKINTLVKIYFP